MLSLLGTVLSREAYCSSRPSDRSGSSSLRASAAAACIVSVTRSVCDLTSAARLEVLV